MASYLAQVATMTSDNVLEALRLQGESRKENEVAKSAGVGRRERQKAYPETKSEIAHLVSIVAARNWRQEI